MATLTNVNIKKNEDEQDEKNTSGPTSSMISPTSQVSGPASSGVQQGTPSSGRFTNIQKYMGANQGAGSQLGKAIGQNVDKTIGKSTGEAIKAQTGYETGIGAGQQELGKINQYTQNLSQSAPVAPKNTGPVTNEKPSAPGTVNPGASSANTAASGTLSNVVGPAHLASGYRANLGERANYAQQLAGDQDQLNAFLNYRSGKIAADQQRALQEQENAAKMATEAAGKTFGTTQEQLKNPNQRGVLLNDVARNRSYGSGQQSLDKAFLQMDKANTVGNLQKDLQQKQQQFNTTSKLPALTEQGTSLRTGLTDATTGLQKQTEQNLTDLNTDISSREQQMNQARQDRMKELQAQFRALQSGGEVNQDFIDALGLKEGDSTYNVLADLPGVENVVDTSRLQQLAQTQGDLANQGDVDLMSAFARLAQTNPSLTQASNLGDFQQSDAFADQLAQGKKRYEDTLAGIESAQASMNARSHGSNYLDDALKNPGRYGLTRQQAEQMYANPSLNRDAQYANIYASNRQAYHDAKEEQNRLAAIRDLLMSNTVKVKK